MARTKLNEKRGPYFRIEATVTRDLDPIGRGSKIISLTQKDQKTIQAEMDKAKIAKSNIAPVWFIATSAKVSDIKVGNTITAIASENARTLKDVPVSSIQIMPSVNKAK